MNGSRKTIAIQFTRHILQYPAGTDVGSMADIFRFDAERDLRVEVQSCKISKEQKLEKKKKKKKKKKKIKKKKQK